MITQTHFAILGGVIFTVGLTGICIRRDTVGLIVALMILFVAPVIEFFGFAHLGLGTDLPPQGDVVALTLLCLLVIFALLFLGLGLVMWRRESTVDVDDFKTEQA